MALKVVKGEKTLAELSSEFGVHANQIGRWRKQLLETLPELFTGRRKKKDKDTEELVSKLYWQSHRRRTCQDACRDYQY